MGTNNFHNNRASKIYAVETSYYDDEIEQTVHDDFIWSDTRENISAELSTFDKNNRNVDFIEDDTISLDEELRSYPATSIGRLYSYFSYAGLEDVVINVIAKTVSGYYSGFNLDYEFYMEWEGGYYDSVTDLLNDFIEEYPEKRGVLKIHSERLIKYLSNDIFFLIDNLERVYQMYTEPLNKVAQFSDGTALYEKA